MKKNNVSIAYFLLNESFQRYIIDNNNEDSRYWEEWIKINPETSNIFNEAKELITIIYKHKRIPDYPSVSKRIFEKLQKQIFEMKREYIFFKKVYLKYTGIAATLALFAGLFFLVKNNFNQNTILSDNQYLQVIVPNGQRSQLILPDGSKVWLNAGTTFKYPSNFSQNNREVFVDGEAFFKVEHRDKMPFKVHTTDNITIKVLGTEFNIKAYKTDKAVVTTLVNGSIQLFKQDNKKNILQELNLKPNEKAVYQKNNQQFIISEITKKPELKKAAKPILSKKPEAESYSDMEVITAWKDDALVFSNETFEEIAIRLERWYGMKITIKNENLKKVRFTGKFVNNETIFQVLEIFTWSEKIKYILKNKEIIIS